MEKMNNPILHSNTTKVEDGIALVESLRSDIDWIKERGKTINEQ